MPRDADRAGTAGSKAGAPRSKKGGDRADGPSRDTTDLSPDAAIELRRPAAAILLASDVLRTALERKASDEEIRRLVSIISANSVNLVRLAGAAVDRAPEDQSVVVRRYEMSGLLDDVLAEVEPWAQRAGVRLEVKRRPATVLADAPRLRHVVRALLTNAITSTSTGGAVRLRVSVGLTVVRLFVTEAGAGSAGPGPDAGGSPGRRRDVSTMVATARSLLEAQGGRLDYTTHDEAGATFVVTVRRAGAHPSGSLR